jgi:hypothetical protein
MLLSCSFSAAVGLPSSSRPQAATSEANASNAAMAPYLFICLAPDRRFAGQLAAVARK